MYAYLKKEEFLLFCMVSFIVTSIFRMFGVIEIFEVSMQIIKSKVLLVIFNNSFYFFTKVVNQLTLFIFILKTHFIFDFLFKEVLIYVRIQKT